MPYRESEDPETINALGIALTDAGRAAEALPIFAARDRDRSGRRRGLPEHRHRAARSSTSPDEARKNLETALTLGKRHTRAWNALGVAWMQLGAPEKAIDAWEHCVELSPEQYDALYNIGRVSGQLGDWKKARAALERFVATAPPASVREGHRRGARRAAPTWTRQRGLSAFLDCGLSRLLELGAHSVTASARTECELMKI